MEDSNIMAVSPNPDDGFITNTVRRSARTKKIPAKYDEEYVIPSKQPSQPSFTAATDRPKRKAAEVAREQIVSEEVASLQEEIFAHMNIDERKEYRGWVELESEPAFFNAMLQDLDAKSLKVQEVFALDEVTLAGLPKPVHGLIFLYEWTNEDESNEARQACPDNLWFGNQTTANACATVALMNIIMNARSVEFGSELEEFRNKTKLLSPPHRGYALDTNDFIRAIHNSVARRNDLLSEDLLLDNQFEAASKKRKTPPKKRKKMVKSGKNKRNSKNSKYETGTYHYIAFVPVDGQVWELDGLENMPLCLGPYTGEAWLGVASEAIQNRMSRQNNDFLSFNLLAICESPLVAISRNLATSFATAKALDEVVAGAPSWENFADDRLARFNLTREQILTQYSPHPSFDARVNDPSFDLAAAKKFAEELRTEQEVLEAQYIAEIGTVDEAVEMIRARRQDYTPAVHEWVRVLAEAGMLRELIEEMDSPS